MSKGHVVGNATLLEITCHGSYFVPYRHLGVTIKTFHVEMHNHLVENDMQKVTLAIAVKGTVLPAKSDIEDVFCLQSNKGLMIDRSLVY